MRFTRILAPVLVATVLAGCIDGPTSSIAPGQARLVLAPQFIQTGPEAGLPIEIVRVTPRFFPEGSPAGAPRDIEVSPNDDAFEIQVPVDLGDRDTAVIEVLVELISEASGQRIVEWSALVGPVVVIEGETSQEQSPTQLFRGPIENMNVDSVIAFGPEFMLAGTSAPAYAIVLGEGTNFTVVWATSDESIATVDPVGDSVRIQAHDNGVVWIYAGAGTKADSFPVLVDTAASAGEPAFLFLAPQDSILMVPGSTRQFSAVVTDSFFVPVTATVSWQSLDPTFATVSGTGLVTAQAIGRARIVASSSGLADTVVVNVASLPAGVDRMWVGGTLLAENDWFTADNWSPSGVPTATDVIYIPAGVEALHLTANASVGSIHADSTGFYLFYVTNSTLTINGDLIAPFVSADSLGRIVMAGTGVLRSFSVPGLTITGDVDLAEDVFADGDVIITGAAARLDLQRQFSIFSDGDFSVIGGGSLIVGQNDTTFSAAYVYVYGDMLFDGGDSSGELTGGWIDVKGDFTVTAASCSAFQPTGTGFEMAVDTSTISIGCSSPTGNRFQSLYIYPNVATQRVLNLASNVYVLDELYLDGENMLVNGNGNTLQTRNGFAYYATLNRTFIEVVGLSSTDGFSTDSITITGMTGETRPQIVFEHPGICASCYGMIDVFFDTASAGPYIEVTDTDPPGDTLIVYMERNPGDGPARTVTGGGALVYWAEVPFNIYPWSGDFQSGTQHQPLADSLIVRVVDYNFEPVSGVVVDFVVTVGDGSVSPASVPTDTAGLAATQFTIGDTAFATQEVRATTAALPGDTVVFVGFPTPVSGGVPQQRMVARPVRPVPRAQPVRREPHVWPMPPERPRGTTHTGDDR